MDLIYALVLIVVVYLAYITGGINLKTVSIVAVLFCPCHGVN